MLVVVEEVPGRRLALVRQDPPPHRARRVAVLLLWLAGIVVSAVAFVLPGSDSFFFHATLAALLFLPGYVAFNDLRGRLTYWSHLAWDADRARFEARLAGRWLFGSRVVSIPFSRIDALGFEIGSEEGWPLQILMRLDYRGEAAPQESRRISIPFRVAALDRRAEGMDLLCRVARIMGRRAYAVRRADHRCLRLDLPAEGAPERGALIPVPPCAEPADYENDAVAQALFVPPPPAVPPFDFYPQRPIGQYTVEEWAPGRRVRIEREQDISGDLLGAASAGSGIMCLVSVGAALLFELTGMVAAPRRDAVLVGVAAGLADVGRRLYGASGRAATFDWPAREAVYRRYGRTRRAPLDAIAEVVLRGRERLERLSSVPHPFFWCEVVVRLGGASDEEVVLETRDACDDPDTPYQQALPLAAGLASALGVPFRWEEYADAFRRAIVRRILP